MSESAVIVPVPEAEPVVGAFRASLDRSAGWGVPAHVTVIYPFLAPDRLGPDELRRLRDAVRSVPRFEVSFTEVRWFADTVVWLAPHPAEGFRALIDAVWSAFPECPPYRGAFGTPVPHLTIGDDAALDTLSAAGDAVSRRLPVTASVHVAHLFQGSAAPGAWRSVAELPLG
ncbi:2'-5' RNA ligase family protein [Pseudonocardia alaniniphila]|uniref:2'-5' RNA ligase family protein n=1 Tax=Pseudonocardia alaniniphila TaxID=75291 RepID=A0ABS9TQ37_9PSEU|nr:2'-5' RNA ligase family protein [Pseudonocardia alaniniphila]MCH6170654.1 2'-5' RNA ligase family protein [Pseudonocardia alaniniphila]